MVSPIYDAESYISVLGIALNILLLHLIARCSNRRSVPYPQFVTVTKGWQILYIWEKDQLNVHGLGALICGGSIVLVNLAIGCVLCTLTLVHLRTEYRFSANYKSYQFKILRALLVQSAIPIIFVYIPVAIGMSLPLFITEERKGSFDICFTMISSFPALDAVVIILLLKDYREGLLCIFRRRRDSIEVVTVLNR